MRLIVCILFALFLQSCVVERLLKFKNQLKNPEKYIHFNDPGLLKFRYPILHLEDIQLLTGVLPTKKIDNQVTYDFLRPEAPNYSFTYTLIFKDEKLVIIDYPDVFFNALEATFAFDSLGLLGNATLPDSNTWTVGDSDQSVKGIPLKKDIENVFGPPTIVTQFSNEIIYHYHYTHPVDGNLQYIKVSISFDKKTNKATQLFLQLPDRNWKINL